MKASAVWFVMIACAGLTQAQKTTVEFPRFTMEAGRKDADDLPLSGAKLCELPKGSTCFEMPSKMANGSNKVEYQFGLAPQSERLPLKGGGSLVFFTGTFSGGASGTLERLALLRSEAGGRIVNLLPYVAVTNQSERRMDIWPEMSRFPVLLTADFVWGEGETHFAPHFYNVEVYRYNGRTDRYEKALTYTTSRKYNGLDSTEKIHVLGAEKKEILRRLKAAK